MRATSMCVMNSALIRGDQFNRCQNPCARRPRRWLMMCAAGYLAGCAGHRLMPDAEQTIGRVTGCENAVTFKVEGGPIDEATSDGDRLTMADALRLSINSDPGLQAGLARVRMAMADADQARLLPNPVLTLAVR